MATALMIVVLLALMPLRVPVCAAMGISAITGLMMLGMPLNTLVRYMATDVRSVPLLAIPFFVLAGNLMNQFNMTKRIFDFLEVVIGYFSRRSRAGRGARRDGVRRHLRLRTRHHRGARHHHDPRDAQCRLSHRIRRRAGGCRFADGSADPAVDHVHHLCGADERLGRGPVRRRHHSRHHAWRFC